MTPEQLAAIKAMDERARDVRQYIGGWHPESRTAVGMELKGEYCCCTGDGFLDTLFEVKPEGFYLIQIPDRRVRGDSFLALCLEKPSEYYTIKEIQGLFDEFVARRKEAYFNLLLRAEASGANVFWERVPE